MKKYLLSVILLTLVFSPALTYGATNNSALIAQLRARVADLQRQLVLLQNQSTINCPLDKDLTLGDGHGNGLGANVVLLQNWLRASGYLNIPKPTGYFGPLTRSALKHWQRDNNLTATGKISAGERLALCGQVN
ncbi:MAG: peptidoglycan-binding domain-containing protein [Candidatus Paceibacterota bacterium]|jgi:peptidoglycan hydrolase-like protein with peptidoglycan-binding domain